MVKQDLKLLVLFFSLSKSDSGHLQTADCEMANNF